MRPIETHMMLQRPAEMTAGRSREMQQTATNVNLGPEIDKDTQEEKARVQHTAASEQTRLRPDEDGGNSQGQGQGKGKGRKKEAADKEQELLKQQASARLTNLPVDEGKYARQPEHNVDIII